MTLVLLVVLGALVLFFTERVPPAVVALLVLAVLLVSGLVSPAEGLAGFSNPATVTVTGMFVVSAALERTGLVDRVGTWLGALLGRRYRLGWALLMAGAAASSAFINNTTVVAILIPVLLKAGRDAGISPSRLLLPVSFAAMFGGVCTLVGTSTNLVVSSLAQSSGLEGFGFFELAPMGLGFTAAGLAYLALVSRWIPERRPPGRLSDTFEMRQWVTDIRLLEGAPSVGRAGDSSRVLDRLDRDVIDVFRDGERLGGPLEDVALEPGDVLRIRAEAHELARLARAERFEVCVTQPRELESTEHVLVEVVVLPESWAVGLRIDALELAERFGALPLAIRHRGRLDHARLGEAVIQPGDSLLLRVPKSSLAQVREDGGLLVVSRHGQSFREEKTPVVLAVLAAVVGSAALGWLPIEVAVVAGACGLLLTGCLTLEEAVQGVQWNVTVLLAGLLALGAAIQSTGADAALADWLVGALGDQGPRVVLAALYAVTVVMTSAMSNNAAAAVLTPIAITTAGELGVDPRPLLMAVTYGASASFLTPVGYQTNTMIYGVGGYRFTDFTRIGGPLNLLLGALAVWLIPVWFPFH